MSEIHVAGALLNTTPPQVTGTLVQIDGEPFYQVANYDAMPPFFMSVASDSDHWLFLSSNGALTAGRRDPDHALFPYYTDDRIHDSQDQTGSLTLLRVQVGGKTFLWEPFSQRCEGFYPTTRSLFKSAYGNKILFEERNDELGLVFRYAWMNSERFGFVRRATLVNLGAGPVTVEVLDGIQNVLPWGVERRFQVEYSALADGYKRTELVAGSPLALFRLSSVPVDKAEPSEALRVNLAWSVGLEPARRLLSTAQLGVFRRGGELQEETDVRGQRGAYLVNATLTLDPGASRDWHLVAELGQDAVGVEAIRAFLATTADPVAEVRADIERGTQNLVRLVASSDGLQCTRDPLNTWRHFSNTLFNIMRGGLPDDGYRLDTADFRLFLHQTNRTVAARHAAFLEDLPGHLAHADLLARVAAQKDVDLERLANEYLPLTFSRRHGDPSRPWNSFAIQVKDEQGRRILNYEGNWRDIFQNWEALGHAFPGYLESMLFKFADSSTVDGHNPYRLLRAGFDWEVIDPHDAWSFIGYWGDHQVIYLLKLLEAAQNHHPGTLSRLLRRRVFTYANVPYRIRPYPDMLANPHSTIAFDQAAHDAAMALVARLGADGLALMDAKGPVHANLAEKLLLVALAKLTSFVPEAGIWMNTQRPEWNDANNALVGFGVSMVTLCYLRRYLTFCSALFQEAGPGELMLAKEIAALLEAIHGVLEAHAPRGAAIAGPERKQVLDALGKAGTDYRAKVYARGFSGSTVTVPAAQVRAFCAIALEHIDHAIRRNLRPDGLYHAYNLMQATPEGIEIRHLYEMLEGQVAVLSSGALSGEEAVSVLDALRASPLYRADQASYILYPDHPLPHFLEKNTFTADDVAGSELLGALHRDGDRSILDQDVHGRFHFNAALRNAGCLRTALAALEQGPRQALVAAETSRILELYERVFDHQSFTGRSGTFYKYEGLGCIYWHMVSKLLLAVDEVRQAALAGDPAVRRSLDRHYHDIRAGLGVHKSPALHGAIPTDPYSHTPVFAGAQQPGMTGQVKEDLLTRFTELGVQVRCGRIRFQPALVEAGEFLEERAAWTCLDLAGAAMVLDLEPGTLGFTLCQVPIVVHRAGPPRLVVTGPDGATRTSEGLVLDAATSAGIFGRTGEVRRLDAFLGL